MTRWMRIFILVLLLPAYGFAAVHAEPYGFQRHDAETAVASLETVDADQDDTMALLSELSDTSDDACDHCMPYAYVVTAWRVRLWSPPLELPQAPDAVLRRALRPPSSLPA